MIMSTDHLFYKEVKKETKTTKPKNELDVLRADLRAMRDPRCKAMLLEYIHKMEDSTWQEK